jgi:putative NADPH-quinone reductase
MRVLIVFCHPAPDSLLAEMRRRVEARLTAEGHEVETIDLYAESFDPVMSEADWRAHRRFERPDERLDRHVEALIRAQALMLIYPTWWFGMPALLKGWFDRVWQAKIAFDMTDGKFQIHKLKNITRFAAISSHGSPRLVIDWLLGNPGRKTLRGLKLQLAPRAGFLWRAFYGVDAQPRTKIETRIVQFEAALSRFLRSA